MFTNMGCNSKLHLDYEHFILSFVADIIGCQGLLSLRFVRLALQKTSGLTASNLAGR
jgi:hypothetical protein